MADQNTFLVFGKNAKKSLDFEQLFDVRAVRIIVEELKIVMVH